MTDHILFPSPQRRKDQNAKLDMYIDDSLKRISRANVTPTDDLR